MFILLLLFFFKANKRTIREILLVADIISMFGLAKIQRTISGYLLYKLIFSKKYQSVI